MGRLTPVIAFVARTDAISEALWLDALRASMPGFDIVAFCDLNQDQRNAIKVAIVVNPAPEDIAALPSLVWVQSLWAGVETIAKELSSSPVKIVRLIDPELSATMAQAVLAWVLYLHRDMPAYARQQREAVWHQLPLKAAAQTHVGLLGLGELGRAAAQCLMANGFQVCGWSRSQAHLDGVRTFHGDAGLDEMLGQVDIIVILLPLTPQTTGLLDAQRLAKMKQGASVINFARGAIIKTADLVANLDAKLIAHAVLDVFETEPLPSDDLLWQHPSITILPHISAPTNKCSASKIVAAHVTRYFESGEIPVSIDSQAGY